MKTVIITITHGGIVRNMLRSDVFKILKSNKNLRIILAVLPLTEVFKNKSFAAEFEGKNVVVENLPFKLNIVERVLRKMAEVVFFNINYVETDKIREMMLKKKKYSRYLLLKLVKKILGKDRNLIGALERLDMFLFKYKCKRYKDLFEKYNPSLIFSTDFLCPYEWGLIKAAKRYKVPIISMIANWDHLTKGRLPKSDKVIVWNDFQKRQLIEYYDYNPSDILVSGIPHLDYFVREKDKFLSKKEFLKSIGAPTDKKLITYTTAPVTGSPFEQDIIEIICKAIKNGEITHPSHLHVRFHPADHFNRYEKLKKFENIITFEKPGKSVSGTRYEWCPSEEDMLHYVNLLSCSDVLINVASTVTIDAAAFDTPIVNIAFDGYEKREFVESNARYFHYTHYSNIAKSKGVKIAKNADELIKFINMYLNDPGLDSKGRKRILKEQCYKLDGRAGERVANYILDFLKSGE